MPQITAWQCPKTGELFSSKHRYKRHLKELAARNIDQRRLTKIIKERESKMTDFRNGLSKIDDIDSYVFAHQKQLWDFARTCRASFNYSLWSKIPADWYPILKYVQFNLTYSDTVSNTHSCPLNGVTNWGGRKRGAPTGYPGYSGFVKWGAILPEEGRPKNIDDHIVGSLFEDRSIGINTGTGGHRGGNLETGEVIYQFGVEIFLDDFEGLKRERFLHTLAGE